MIDNYARIILTVIALSTSFNALQGPGLIKTATAKGVILSK